MQRWTLPVIVLLLAFLATTAFLSYQAAKHFMLWRNTSTITSAYSPDNYPPSADETTKMLEELRGSGNNARRPEVGALYVDMLARNAWNYPATSVDDLHEAIEVSQDIYRTNSLMRPYLVRWNMYLYSAAGLPTKVEMWQSEAIAKDPASLEYVRYFQMSCRIMADDRTGARELLEAELGEGEPRPTVAGLAVAGYSMLGDYNTAAEYEPLIKQYGLHDEYFKHMYAGFLVEQGRYADALATMEELEAKPEKDPQDAFHMALLHAGIDGIDDAMTQSLIELSLASTSHHPTPEGVRVEILTELYRIEENPVFLDGAISEYALKPEQFDLAFSMASAAVSCRDLHQGTPRAQGEENSTGLTANEQMLLDKSLVQWTREALSVAEHDYEYQMANVLLATVLLYPQGTSVVDQLARDEALTALQRALGDPDVADCVMTQRMPDFEYFLLDDNVIAARGANHGFDLDVHHAIVDYLNRRHELFKDVVNVAPLPYRHDV